MVPHKGLGSVAVLSPRFWHHPVDTVTSAALPSPGLGKYFVFPMVGNKPVRLLLCSHSSKSSLLTQEQTLFSSSSCFLTQPLAERGRVQGIFVSSLRGILQSCKKNEELWLLFASRCSFFFFFFLGGQDLLVVLCWERSQQWNPCHGLWEVTGVSQSLCS